MDNLELAISKNTRTSIGDGKKVACELPIYIAEVDHGLTSKLTQDLGEFALLKRDGSLFLAYQFAGQWDVVRIDDYLLDDLLECSITAFNEGTRVRLAMLVKHHATSYELGTKTVFVSNDFTRMLYWHSETQKASPPSLRMVGEANQWIVEHVRTWDDVVWNSIVRCSGED